jgi:hypothetical protein
MRQLLRAVAVSLCLMSTASAANKCELKQPTQNWRVGGFLWKPTAEHYQGLVIVTLPRGDVKRVQIHDTKGKLVRVPPFRSQGDAGDAWADYGCSGACYQRKYGSVFVRLYRKNGSCVAYLIQRPKRRSDGGGS